MTHSQPDGTKNYVSLHQSGFQQDSGLITDYKQVLGPPVCEDRSFFFMDFYNIR